MYKVKNKSGMVSYYFRFPVKLHSALTKRAKADRRSLVQEIIYLLERAVTEIKTG